MADSLEITHTTTLNWSRNGSSITGKVTAKEDQENNVVFYAHKWITADGVVHIVLGDVEEAKYVMFKNVEAKDSGLNVLIGQVADLDDTNAAFTLEPQEGVVIPNSSLNWYALPASSDLRLLCVAIAR